MAQYSNRMKFRLLNETNGRCYYCGDSLNNEFEIEHIIARVNGGGGAFENLTVSCRRCNINKSDYPIEKFRERIMSTLNLKKYVFYFEKTGLFKGQLKMIYNGTA